jgi:hypothetical protein
MLNKYGFIPSKYRQPDRYERIFEDWTAIFIIGRSEYHVRLVADWRNKKTARCVEILCQGPKCRNVLAGDISSVKQAMEKLEQIIGMEEKNTP